MGYIVLSKRQVEGSLNVKLCKDKDKADLQRKQLHEKNYDVVILDKSDYDVISTNFFKNWVYELDGHRGDNTNSDKHNLFNIMEFGDKYFGGDEEDNDGGDNNNPDPIWNGESEDLLVNSSEENDDLAPQCFHADEDGDEYYMSSNGNRYYLFKKMVTLKGDRAQTIYMIGKKEWSRTNDLTLLRFYNIPYDKCVVENKSGYPFLKTDVYNDHDKHLRDKDKNEII